MGLILPLLLSAGVGLVTSIFQGNQQAAAQDKALAAQTQANDKSIALQKEIFETNKADAQPWIDAGKQAQQTLTTKMQDGSFDLSKYGMEDLIQDPGYQFRLQQGQQAVDRKAAAAGKFLSGDQIKAGSDYAEESASQEFGNAFARTVEERNADYGRLNDQASRGQSAQAALSGASTSYGTNVSNIYANQGGAAADASVNTGNAWAKAAGGIGTSIQQGLENYMLYDRLAKLGVG